MRQTTLLLSGFCALQAQKAAEGRAQLTTLAQQSEQRNRDGYSLNKQLRAALRQSKKADAKVDAK
jgi:hypothetical protein